MREFNDINIGDKLKLECDLPPKKLYSGDIVKVIDIRYDTKEVEVKVTNTRTEKLFIQDLIKMECIKKYEN